MSVQSSLGSFEPSPRTGECGRSECDAEFPVHGAYKGAFCSRQCHLQHRGQKALNVIRNDHRWCATCFRKLKEIERPPMDAPEFVVGYQYPTEHMRPSVDSRGALGVEQHWRRWGCECGNVDHRHRDDILEDVEIDGAVYNLLVCLHELEADGPLTERADPDRLFGALRQRWRDWEYAIGAALYAEGGGEDELG